MADRRHRGGHGRRRQERDAARIQQKSADKTAGLSGAAAAKPRRVFLRNWVYIGLTVLTVLGVVAALVVLGIFGLWDNFFGSLLCILLAGFGCMCLYDVALLMTASISFGEGMVNAGKDKDGHAMLFHASSVLRVEMRDESGRVLPADCPVYKNADLTFVMQSGRANRKRVSRLTQKQLTAVLLALKAEGMQAE